MIGNVVFEVEIEGKKIGFEICMLSLCYTEELTGKPISVTWAEHSNIMARPYVFYFLGAAKAYNKFRNIKDEVTFEDVCRCWDKHRDLLLEQYAKSTSGPKNDSAPSQEMTGPAQ